MQKVTNSEIVHSTHFFHQSCKQVLFLVVSLFIDVAEITLVFLLRVDQCLHCIVASFHAELDTLVENCLRVIRCVHISLRQGEDELLIVIDRGIDDTISDCFGYNLLSLFYAFE